MSRFERLLIPIVAVVAVGAFLLEGLSATAVRRVALGFGIVLAVLLIIGMIHRAKRKRRLEAEAEARAADPGQTSNDPRGSPPQG